MEEHILKYTAIDFETATSKYTSICSVGLCVVENSKIIHQTEILVRPEPFEFSDYNITIHGITPELVFNRFTFDHYWSEIKPYLENTLVIAHNTSFDINVLKSTLDMFNIPYPSFNYLCTVKLSQKAYPDFYSHKLNNLCAQLGISEFNHHNAKADAIACAKVFEHILSDFNLKSLSDIENQFEIGIGTLYPGFHEPCKKNKNRKGVRI